MLTRWKCYSGCTDFEIADLFEGDGGRAASGVARCTASERGDQLRGPGPVRARVPLLLLPFCSITYVRIAEWNGITGSLD